MLAALDLKTIAEISAVRMVDCLVEGTAVAAFGALLFRMLRRHGAGVRFTILFSALVGVAVLPLFSGVWASDVPGVAAHALPDTAAVVVPGSWALYLFAAWGLIASVALLRVGIGLIQLWRLRCSCHTVNLQTLDPTVRETIQNQEYRRVELCTSGRVQSPTAIGLLHPAVILPEWLLHELSPSELKQVLLHELAHLRRWDDWTNLVQQIVKALCFFHPAVWWMERRLALEREMACDDEVLAHTQNPRSYAECLTLLAEKSLFRRSVALAQAAVGRLRDTSLRVTRILHHNPPAQKFPLWRPLTLLSSGLAACLLFVIVSPQLIAFRDQAIPGIHPDTPGQSAIASLNIASQKTSRSTSRPQSAVVVPAKFRTNKTERAKATPLLFHPKRANEGQPILAVSHENKIGSDVRLAKAVASRPVATEAVFIFVENSSSGWPMQPRYQLCIWHVIVLRSINAPIVPAAPRKEI
jgi:bla regulator protein blaR1